MRETLDLLSDDEALADLRQSGEDFAAGDTFSADEVRAELACRRRRARVGDLAREVVDRDAELLRRLAE